MATNASVRIVKSFAFKGGTRQWSNRYHFNGGTPADSTHWNTLFDAITAAEKLVHLAPITIVNAIGYAAGSEVPVASKTYSLAGTYGGAAGNTQGPGECAALIRWSTAARSVKNHPIYCFAYMHGAQHGTGAGVTDVLNTAQKTLYQTYATAWLTGFSDGTITATRATPQGHGCTGQICEEYVTHRDFPPSRSL